MPTQRTTATIAIIAVVLVGLVAGTIYFANRSSSPAAPASTDSSSETTVRTYTDGTYTETGSYSTPGGTETITVTITLADGRVESTSATGSATGGNSAQFQGYFIGNYADEIVGKSIDEVNLTRVAGSSLTSIGFNAAIETIRQDAAS